MGANVGTCITAGLSCIGAGVAGRRVAFAHVLVKIVGVIIVFPFIANITEWITRLNDYINASSLGINFGTSGKIALTHLLFNVFLVILFLPFVGYYAKLVKMIIPDKRARHAEFGPKYLDKSSLSTPSLAFAQVKREILRISKICYDMFDHVFDMFQVEEDFDKL